MKAVFLLGLAAVLPLWKLVCGREMYFLGDALYQHYPWQEALGRVLAGAPGALPEWNPYMFCGSPLLADPQFLAYYPPALLYRFLPFAVAFGCFTAFHVALAVAGMVVFLRSRGLPVRAAALGGFAFGMGGHPSMLLILPPVLAGYAWLPWVAHFAQRVAGRGGIGAKAGLAAAFAWLVLAGPPPSAALAVALAIVVIARAAPPGTARYRALGWGAASLSAALLVTSAAWMPLLAYLPDTGRFSGVGLAEVRAGSFAPWYLLGLVTPMGFLPDGGQNVIGTGYWLSLHFIGSVPLFLAAACWFLRRNARETGTALAIFGIGLVLALGTWLPGIGSFLRMVPPFSQIRHPAVWMGLGDFALAWMAASGLSEVEKRLYGSAGRRVMDWLLAAVVLLGVMGGVARLMHGWYINRWGATAGRAAADLGSVLHPAAVLVLAAILLWLARRREMKVQRAMVLLGAATFIELVTVRTSFQPTVRAASVLAPAETELAISRSGGSGDWYRVFIAPRHQENYWDAGEGLNGIARAMRESFRSNLPAAAGFYDAGGNNPLRPVLVETALDRARIARAPWSEPAAGILSRMGVRYLIARNRIPGDGWPVLRKGYAWVYENPGARGPVRVEPESAGSVRVFGKRRAGTWRLEADLGGPARVVVAETCLKGWRIEGEEAGASLEPTGDGLISIQLPAGKRRISLRYVQPGARGGLAVSILALVSALALGCVRLLRGFRAAP